MEKEKRINDRQFGFRKQRSTIDARSKTFDGFRREEKTAAIFFDIEKACDKVNREKTLEQLENIGIQEIMMKLIRELIGESWIKVKMKGYILQSKQTDFGIPQGGVFNVTLYLVAINGILGNRVYELLFANNLAIYITTRNPRVVSRALQGVTNKLDAWATERGLTFSTNKTVRIIFRKKRKRNHTEKQNYTL